MIAMTAQLPSAIDAPHHSAFSFVFRVCGRSTRFSSLVHLPSCATRTETEAANGQTSSTGINNLVRAITHRSVDRMFLSSVYFEMNFESERRIPPHRHYSNILSTVGDEVRALQMQMFFARKHCTVCAFTFSLCPALSYSVCAATALRHLLFSFAQRFRLK